MAKQDVTDRLLDTIPGFCEQESDFSTGICEGYLHFYDLRYMDQFAPKPLTCGNLMKFLLGNLTDPVVPSTVKDAKQWNTGFVCGWLAAWGENRREFVYRYTTDMDDHTTPRMSLHAEAYEDYIRPSDYPDSSEEYTPDMSDAIDRITEEIQDFEGKDQIAHDVAIGILTGTLDYYQKTYHYALRSSKALYGFLISMLEDPGYAQAFLVGLVIGWCVSLGEHSEKKLRGVEQAKRNSGKEIVNA